jgi:hypothetical protein
MLLRIEKEDDKEGLRASDGDGPKGEAGNKRARLGSLSLPQNKYFSFIDF